MKKHEKRMKKHEKRIKNMKKRIKKKLLRIIFLIFIIYYGLIRMYAM